MKIVVPVWGTHYIETFTKLSLPTQLSKSNLPLISQKYKIEYVIYTLKSDKQQIENSEIIKILKNYTSVRYENIAKFKTKSKYNLYSQIHKRELKKSSKKREGVFLINADFVFSDGFFKQTLNQISSKKRVVNIACPRANLEAIQNILLTKFRISKNIIEINSKELSKVYIKNIHSLMTYHMYPKKNTDDFLPSSLIWKSNNNSLYIRNFHFHPVLIYPYLVKIKKIKMTIDDGYIYKIFEYDEIAFQKNTNDYSAFELSKKSLFYEPIGKYNDSTAKVYYFLGQDASNFINFSQEVLIGAISKKEIINLKLKSEIEISKLMAHQFYEISKYRNTFKFYNLFLRYKLLSIFIVQKKAYIPNFIYLLLKKMHRLIVKEFFRANKYFRN